MAFLIFFLLGFFSTLAFAVQSSDPLHEVAPSTTLQVLDFDLEGGLIRGALSDNLKQSLDLIEKTETLSCCEKIATSALLHSCSNFDGSIDHEEGLPAGLDIIIEEGSEIYAARLAVCELSRADFLVPSECRSFIPAAKGKKSRQFKAWFASSTQPQLRVANDYYDKVTRANLDQCRNALGSSAQAWTSYSNSRQNAVTMCHAMQSAVERDESRHVAKILAHTAAATSQSLQDAYERVREIKQQFHDLSASMPRLQQDLATFDEDIQEQYRGFWEQFHQAHAGLESLNAAIDLTNIRSKEAHDHLEEAYKTVIPKLRRAIVEASEQASNTADTAAASAELMTYAKERVEQVLTTQLDIAGYSLASINEILPQMASSIEKTIATAITSIEEVVTLTQQVRTLQNDALVGIGRIQQTSSEVESSMDGISAQMGELATKMNDTVSNFQTIQEYLGILAPFLRFVGGQIAFALCGLVFFLLLFGHMAGGFIGLGLKCAGATIPFMFVLRYLYDRFTPLTNPVFDSSPRPWFDTSSPLTLSVIGVVLCVAILLTWSVATQVFGARACSPTDELYDPFSPPSGIEAWKIWLLESPPFGRGDPFSRPTSFSKSRV